ncbi:hypothetical protein J2X72_004259 [Phyllobacterium sp. 1468]|uniref:hypothetical protein n=1 Tax=Phyllobacterium sp. 1468 TaxID=2817759 RepID=UPI00285D2167|nr:hypothetical protein [Phyllobacterium sp. 1468]MDR6635445.1 hypothetical protein [Phyllobacterium sp. 1468]
MKYLQSKIDLREKSHLTAVVISMPSLGLLFFSTIFSFQAHAKDVSFVDFPFLVHCESGGADRAYYLSKITADGVAVYISPDNLAGTVTINGAAEPAMGGEGPGSCSGKTLEQLRSAGQAFYLQR